MRRRNNRPDTRALSYIGLDAVMSRRPLEKLALDTDVITVPRGALLARAGYFARQFVAVIDGHVDVIDNSGHTYVALPGTHIGGAELLHRRPHQATSVTRSECHLVVIPAQALASRLDRPGVANWVEEHGAVTRTDGELAAPPAIRILALVD